MRLVLLSLLLLPLAAHAAPLIPILAAIAINVGAYYVATALVIGHAVYSYKKQRKAEKAARNAYNASLQDRTLTRIATEAPHVHVYGRARVGSAIVAMFTSGAKDEYKHLVCVHAAHECDGLEKVWINGKELGQITSSGAGWTYGGAYTQMRTEQVTETFNASVGSVIQLKNAPNTILSVTQYAGTAEGNDNYAAVSYVQDSADPRKLTITGLSIAGAVIVQYAAALNYSYVGVRFHSGYANDSADAYLMERVPASWAASHVLRGLCYSVITLDLYEQEFQGGIPTVEVQLRGKKLYDFRTGVTSWSDNPVRVAYDYLTGEFCNVDAADLPMEQWITAANVCDERTQIWQKNAAGTWAYIDSPRYTLNGTVNSEEDQASTLELMAQSMAGSIVSTTWDIQAGKYVAPVMALQQSDIIGSLSVTPGVSEADLYNTVRGQYTDVNGIATDFLPFVNDAYLAADGRELASNIDFPYTNNLHRVWNLCKIFTEDQRNGYTVRGSFSLKAWKLKVGNRVTLTSALFGWNAKVFRVIEKKFSPTSAVELTLKEDAPSIWDYAESTVVDDTPNSNLPDPWKIQKLGRLSAQSGSGALLRSQDGTITSRILVEWTQARGVVEIEWADGVSNVWQRTQASAEEQRAYLFPVKDGLRYSIRARVSDPYLNVKSDWIYVSHVVTGKTAPPQNVPWFLVEGDTLSWGEVNDIDLAGYRIRFHYGTNRSWGDATPLHSGLIRSSPFTPEVRPHGHITLMVKAVDTSGNESLAPAVIVGGFGGVFGDVAVQNVVELWDFKAQGYATDFFDEIQNG